MNLERIASLAKEAYEAFESAAREGEVRDFIRIKSGSPEWVTDLAYEAHGGAFLPDDYRYRWTMEACEALADGSDPEDGHDFADQVDVYTGALLDWLGSNAQRVGYVDDAVEELGHAADGGIIGDIGLGQYHERLEVYGLVASFLTEKADEEAG